MFEAEELGNLVSKRHPEYEELSTHWEFLDSCYKGGRAWIKNNIHRYHKEGNNEYKDRINRAYRFNHSKEVVDLVDKYLFRAEIKRQEDAPAYLKKFWKNPTGNGRTMDHFSKQMSRRTSTLGRNWVVVDTNAPNLGKLTVAEANKHNVRVYAYLVSPIDVLDMSYDKFGELNWILIREGDRKDENPFKESFNKVTRYRLWTRNEWFEIEHLHTQDNTGDDDIQLKAFGEHGLGIVPVTHVDHIESDNKWTSPAMISDIGYLDKAITNYLSNLDAIIQDQTFSQLAMPAQNLVPGDKDHDAVLEMGTKRVFTFDGESGGQPFYLSPDVKQAEIIVQVIVRIIGEIYHTVGMAGERTKQDNAVGIDNSSGVAKAYDFERINAMLVAKAHALDAAEKRISRIVAKWHKKNIDDKDYIKYPENFDVRGVADELDLANNLALIEAPIEVRKEQMRVLVDKLFPRMDDATRKRLVDDIKGWPENTSAFMNAANDQVDEDFANRQSLGNKRDNSQGQVTDQDDQVAGQ